MFNAIINATAGMETEIIGIILTASIVLLALIGAMYRRSYK